MCTGQTPARAEWRSAARMDRREELYWISPNVTDIALDIKQGYVKNTGTVSLLIRSCLIVALELIEVNSFCLTGKCITKPLGLNVESFGEANSMLVSDLIWCFVLTARCSWVYAAHNHRYKLCAWMAQRACHWSTKELIVRRASLWMDQSQSRLLDWHQKRSRRKACIFSGALRGVFLLGSNHRASGIRSQWEDSFRGLMIKTGQVYKVGLRPRQTKIKTVVASGLKKPRNDSIL